MVLTWLAVISVASAVEAAEVLQVRSSSLLQVGDHNRNYTVQLACLEVLEADEQAAVDFLRQALPRRQRVNLRPEGALDGTLLARVTPLGSDRDLSTALAEAGLAHLSCAKA
ncbi:MAG: nuclease [Synechococcus sp.]|nr:nuclease [Synechococcus sp.]